MHHFRRFLFHSDGEFGCMFWLDVERTKQLFDQRLLRRQITRITELHLHDGAKFALHDDTRTKLLFLSKQNVSKRLNKSSRKMIDTLIRGQELVIKRLKEYWCPRYKLHLEEVDQIKQLPQESNHQLLSRSSVQSLPRYQIGASILSISEQDKEKRKYKSLVYLPRIINDKGKDGIDVRPKNLSRIKLNSSKLSPFIAQSKAGHVLQRVSVGSRDDVHGLDSKMRALQLLLTPSTLTLFPQSNESTLKHCTYDYVSSLSSETGHLSPYITASLRADFFSGNPFLRYLKNITYNSKAVDRLLFWQSVECILTQDEARRWYQRFEPQSLSDQNCPYLSYSEVYPVASDLKELLHLFVKDGAPHKIDMAKEVRKELCMLLPKGLGQSLILAAQEEVMIVSNKITSYNIYINIIIIHWNNCTIILLSIIYSSS